MHLIQPCQGNLQHNLNDIIGLITTVLVSHLENEECLKNIEIFQSLPELYQWSVTWKSSIESEIHWGPQYDIFKYVLPSEISGPPVTM